MALLLGFVATPFEALPRVPTDGVGLNPLLYDEGMRIHPPMLLAGLMSWSVPFAFSIAALATGKLGNEWVALSRRYAMVAWVILGLGNVLGAWWAYHVLGWGGYWGWDPVENVALMPWLVGTAFIHSIQMQERRGMLKAWNVVLFLGIAFAIFWGTIYPLVAEALADQKVSVGPPYFKQVAGPLLGAMILLMGIGPLMPWRRASRDHLVHNFLLPVASTVIGLAIL